MQRANKTEYRLQQRDVFPEEEQIPEGEDSHRLAAIRDGESATPGDVLTRSMHLNKSAGQLFALELPIHHFYAASNGQCCGICCAGTEKSNLP